MNILPILLHVLYLVHGCVLIMQLIISGNLRECFILCMSIVWVNFRGCAMCVDHISSGGGTQTATGQCHSVTVSGGWWGWKFVFTKLFFLGGVGGDFGVFGGTCRLRQSILSQRCWDGDHPMQNTRKH